MEIYKHKVEGLVVLWGAGKMRTSSGNWTEATMYRRMQVTDKGTEAHVLAEVYTVPTAHWKKHAKKFGVLSETPKRGEVVAGNASTDDVKGSTIDVGAKVDPRASAEATGV